MRSAFASAPIALHFLFERLGEFKLRRRFIATRAFDFFVNERSIRCIRIFSNIIPARNAHENVAVACIGPSVD